MSSDRDIYQILESLDAAQRSVKQLPALFKPPQTSPQLDGPYPGQNATRGYMVGEGEGEEMDSEQRKALLTAFKKKQLPHQNLDLVDRITHYYLEKNPMAQAVMRRISNTRPELYTRYGAEAVLQAIADVTDGDTDWEEIGSSDVSAYVNYVADALRDRQGSREEMDNRRPFAEEKDDQDEEAELNRGSEPDHGLFGDDEAEEDEQYISEGKEAATEDILSAVKARLGDYIQDVATAIKKDPDLLDKLPDSVDQIRAVKTIKTDDGHEIKILGNEDDGFRISIKNNKSNSKFSNLDEAVMAVEMFCARRRSAAESADYIEEKQ
jgi:hypothetical protein